MAGTIYIFNGPNLNLLGVREPQIYGQDTLEDIAGQCRAAAEPAGFAIDLRQTNLEGELVGWLQEVRSGAAGIVINPAAFSYAAYSVLDAIKMADCPVIEVHISNIHRREEEWRSRSIMTQVCTGVISGLGTQGYRLAVEYLVRRAGAF